MAKKLLTTYTEQEMKDIREFAYNQWERDDYTVSVESKKTGQSVNNPWVDGSGRWEFDTDEEALKHWGKAVFYGFCEKALVYMYQHQFTVTEWR